MHKNNQHVVPSGNEWAVVGEGHKRKTAIVETQKQAIKIARTIAINNNSEVVIHGKNGKIRDKDSYGNDPSSIRDKKF